MRGGEGIEPHFKFGFIGGFQTIPAPQISEWGRGPMGLTEMVTDVNFPLPIMIFLKVLGIHKGLFQKSLMRGSGAEPLVLRSPRSPINCNLYEKTAPCGAVLSHSFTANARCLR